jgi:hypothetical protein
VGPGVGPGWVRGGSCHTGAQSLAGRKSYIIADSRRGAWMSSLRSPYGFRSRPPRQCQVPMQSPCGFRSRTSIARDPPAIRHEQNEGLVSNACALHRASFAWLPTEVSEERDDGIESAALSLSRQMHLRLSVRGFQGARKAQSKLSRAHTAGGNTQRSNTQKHLV